MDARRQTPASARWAVLALAAGVAVMALAAGWSLGRHAEASRHASAAPTRPGWVPPPRLARPLLQTENPRAALRSLLEVRDPLYRQTADLIVETGRQSVNKLVSEIQVELARHQLWPSATVPDFLLTNAQTTPE